MLCSDGLYGVMDDHDLLALMQQEGEVGAIAERLVNAAIAHGTRDNITALVVRYQAES
jgi:protein phosphatase